MEDDNTIDESSDHKIQTIDKDQMKVLMGEEDEADDEEDMDFSPDVSDSSVNESGESSFEMDKVSKKTKSKTKSSVKRDVEASNGDDDEDDDSDSDVLHIHSEDESEEEMVCEDDKQVCNDDSLEEKLTEDAIKNHLTANNVKNILLHVITSKEVVDMVKNTIATEDVENLSDKPKNLVEATYEPKMTRSKMKEVMEKGKIPQVWPLSPLKTGSKNKPSFLELEFSDDEDDEYNPDKDPVPESDDESTSFLSSQASDFGSPCPLTPSTPANHPRPSTSKKTFFVSPAVPVNKSAKTDLSRAFENVAETDEEFLQREINNDYGTVARRTRSKLPLTSTSLLELESTLIEVAPDITEDMYDTNLGQDQEWQEFLSSLYTATKIDVAPQESQEVGDDETNDPEYDYLGEAEHEEKDEEDYKYCRPYKIPKKEMFDLLDQLTEFMASDQEDDEGKRYARGDSTESDENKKKKNKSHKPSTEGLQFTSSQLLILQDQIRRHIQLTTQFYFLCLGCEDYKHMTKVCVKHLNEFGMFRKASMVGENSSFNVCNLTESLELVQQDRCWDIDKELEDIQSMSFDDTISNVSDSDDGFTDSTFKRQQAKSEAILESQKEIFWNNRVFFYPDLLPKRRLMTLKEAKESRVFFTLGEDKMIALAMDQFGTTPKHYNLIHKYLMPAKTVKQISFRIKNLASKRSQDNPVKLYKKKKILPENATLFHIFSIDSMIAPNQQNIDLLPKWCKKYKDSLEKKGKVGEECKKVEDEKVEDKKITKKKNTRSFKTSTKAKKTPKKSPYKPLVPVSPKPSKTRALPTALITSAGLFVPIRYASPSKLPPDLQSAIIDGSPYLIPTPQPKITPEKIDSPAACSSNYYNTPTPDSTSQPSPCPVTDHLTHIPSELPDSTDNQTPSVSLDQSSSLATATKELTTDRASQAIGSVAPDSTGHSITFSGDDTSGKEKHVMKSCPMDETEDQQTEGESCNKLKSQGLSEQRRETDNLPKDILKQPKHVGFIDLHSQASPVSDRPDVKVLNDEKHLSDEVPSDQYQPTTDAALAKSDNPIDKDSSRESMENKEEECMAAKPVSKTIVAVSQNNLSGILVTTPVPSPVNMEVFSTASNDMDTIHQKEAMDTVTPTKDQTDAPLADTSGSFLSTPSSLASSVNSSTNNTPKTAVEIVATLAPFYNSYLVDPVVTQQSQLETTPKKYRELVPKSDLPQPALKQQLFLSPKKKFSPKVTRLKRGVRAILPKGYIHDVKISPTKRAANQIKRKAAKIYHKGTSPNKLLLPKPPSFTDSLHYPNTRYQKQLNLNNNALKSNKRRLSESEKMEESDEHQSEVEDACNSQDESQPEDDLEDVTIDDNLEELMAASTTIRFDPRKSSHQIHDNKTKAQKRREMNIALLAPDILESDPKRDDRDTAFAQAYMHQVKETLSDDMETYEQFLLLMCEFGKGTQSPINLYKSLCDLLKSYPELIEDFAGFLRPEEAVECDCFSINQEYQRANEFLRKLEINFEKQPTQFQRILRCFDKWQKNVNKTGDQLKTQIRSLLRSSPMLLQEFDLFFPDEKIPECHPEDFEEVNLSDNSDNEDKDDGFEEIDIPAEYDTYRTKRCPCDCHKDPNDTKLQARLKHCYDCSLKNVDGGLYFQTSKNKLQPVKVVFHKVPAECLSDDSPPGTVEAPVSPTDRPTDKLSIDDKDNEMSPPISSVIPNTGESPLKHCSLKKAKKMKLKTDKNKPGEKRFLSLNEITSPVKCSTSDNSNLTTSVDATIPSTMQANIPGPTFTAEDSLSIFLDPNKTVNINQDKPWATINENSSSDLLAKAVKGTLGNIFSKPFLINENSTADILAAALKEAEIQRGDVSMDSNFFRTMMNSPTKSLTGSAASVSGSQLSFRGALNPIFSDLLTQPNTQTQTQSYSQTVTTTGLETMTNVNPVTINTSELLPLIGISNTLQSSSGAMVTSVSDVNFPTVMSGTMVTSQTLSKSDSVEEVSVKKEKSISDDVTWSREMDRIILEMCQTDGAKPETYQTISQKLVTKSPQEITERFKVLMELLTDSHDEEDSEEEMTE